MDQDTRKDGIHHPDNDQVLTKDENATRFFLFCNKTNRNCDQTDTAAVFPDGTR